MFSLPYLVGLAIAGIWLYLRPRLTLGRLFALWWAGSLMTRLVPGLLGTILLGGRDASSVAWIEQLREGISWLGAVLLLRAFLGLTLWERPRKRRTIVWAVLFAIGMVGPAFSKEAGGTWWVNLAIPWLWSFRWRSSLSAGWLAVACLSALAHIPLQVVSVSWTPSPESVLMPRLTQLTLVCGFLTSVYAFLAAPAAAARVHLSIRRIGRRLIVSHLLAGVIPSVLAILFVLLSGALFLSTYRGSIGSRYLANVSGEAKKHLIEEISLPSERMRMPFENVVAGQALISRAGSDRIEVHGAPLTFAPESLLVTDASSGDAPLLWDGGALFVRARVDTVLDGVPLSIEGLAPVDSLRMGWISRIAGVAIRVNPQVEVMRKGGGVQIGGLGGEQPARSIGPREPGRGGLPGGSIIRCLFREDGGWKIHELLVSSSASFGEPVLALFTIARENPLATVVLVVLGVIAFFIVAAIWITILMVFAMGRSITHAVRALTTATAALAEGKFDHRIPLEGNDELWSVATSFNEMAGGLEKGREKERQTQRLEEELRLAREIQDRLLPSSPPALERVELAGTSLPAREIGGDYFDYIALEGGRVGITVADVSGKGAPAALLMSTFRASLRSQDLSALGPAEVLGRLNRFIHSSVDPGKFITAFLCLLDPETGELRYANAGHDPPLMIGSDGSVAELTGGGLILGLLPQLVYEEARAILPPGSLVAIFTDGITEAQDPAGEFFGAEKLAAILRRAQGESCAEIVKRVVGEIQAFSATAAQFDDITLVLARRH